MQNSVWRTESAHHYAIMRHGTQSQNSTVSWSSPTLWSSVTMPTALGMIIAVFFFVMLVMLDTEIFIYSQALAQHF